MINETFLRLLNETLNLELGLSLTLNKTIVSQGTNYTFDLIDRVKSTYVIIFEEMPTINRYEIGRKINSFKRALVSFSSSTNEPPNFFIICQNTLQQKELEFYKNEFNGNDGIRYHFLDIIKVIELAKNNGVDIPSEFNDKTLFEKQVKSALSKSYAKDLGNVYENDEELVNADSEDENTSIVKKSLLTVKLFQENQNYYWFDLSTKNYNDDQFENHKILNYPILEKDIPLLSKLKKGDLFVLLDMKRNISHSLCVFLKLDSANKNILVKLISVFEVRKKASEILKSLDISQRRLAGIYYGIANKLEEDVFYKLLLSCIDNFEVFQNNLNIKNRNQIINKNIIFPFVKHENSPSIAPFLEDTPTGDDYLEIKNDVAAFSKVLCMKELPTPLSIALFGEWGSGKSFFMQRLRKEIENHSKEKNPFYCNNIIHIEFNAWSYLDANLWASLASIIFEAIHKELNKTNDINEAVKGVIKSTTDKISFVEQEKEQIKHKIETFELKLEEIKQFKETRVVQLSQLENDLSSHSEQKIVKTILQELKVKETIEETIKSLHLKKFIDLNVETKYQVENLIKEVNKLPFTFKAIFSNVKYYQLLIVFLIIGVVIGLGFWINLDYLNQKLLILPEVILGIISVATPILLRIKNLMNKIQPVIQKVNELNDQVQIKYAEKISNSKQEIELLNTEILAIRREIEFQNQEQLLLENEKQKLIKRLNGDLFSEAFKTRINYIISTNKYHDHLGLVSQLRKDFGLLSDLFVEQKKTGKTLKKEDDSIKPIQRIILYIDDLDRCSEDIVIAVLEAVNLLLAFPLFVVVVGVDHRWVKNALITKHYKQFGIEKTIHGYEPIEPSTYLEKIFQIPFHLKKASSDSVKKMIGKLIESNLSNETIEPSVETEKPKIGRKRKFQPDQKPSETRELKEPIMGGTTQSDSAQIINAEVIENKAHTSSEELLQLSDYEKRLFLEFDFVIGSNPRTIKRFVNIYRIVRAHAELPGGKNKDEENLICMFLVALAVGDHKSVFQKLNKYLEKNYSVEPFNILLKQNNETENKLRFLISENAALKKLLDLNFNKYRDIFFFVSRFSFRYEINEMERESENDINS